MHLTEKPTWGFRLTPRAWPALFRALEQAPDDILLGAKIFFSLGGHDEAPNFRRFLRTRAGTELVRDRTPYPALFKNYEALGQLPSDTLGRQYAEQLRERGIHPTKLDALSHQAYEGMHFSPEHAYVRDRVRETHDLFHTLTGYGIDVVGESGVLGFTFGQSGNKGWAVLTFLNVVTSLTSGRLTGLRNAWRGYRAGRRAAFVPARPDLDRLLRMPLDEARRELGVEPAPDYRPIHAADLWANSTNHGPRRVDRTAHHERLPPT